MTTLNATGKYYTNYCKYLYSQQNPVVSEIINEDVKKIPTERRPPPSRRNTQRLYHPIKRQQGGDI